jgi:hypothetical protein
MKCKVSSQMVVSNKYYLYVFVLTKNKISHINIVQETDYTLNNKINEKMVILEKIRKKQIWTNYDEDIHVTTFNCRLRGEM